MNEWVWNNGGMILTGENWSTGRKTLYSVGGRWMNEYGAMVEWYWLGKTEVLGETPTKIATVYTLSSTWPSMGLNPGLRGERPATNRLWNHPVITCCRGVQIPAAKLPWRLHFLRWCLIFVGTPLLVCAVCTIFVIFISLIPILIEGGIMNKATLP